MKKSQEETPSIHKWQRAGALAREIGAESVYTVTDCARTGRRCNGHLIGRRPKFGQDHWLYCVVPEGSPVDALDARVDALKKKQLILSAELDASDITNKYAGGELRRALDTIETLEVERDAAFEDAKKAEAELSGALALLERRNRELDSAMESLKISKKSNFRAYLAGKREAIEFHSVRGKMRRVVQRGARRVLRVLS